MQECWGDSSLCDFYKTMFAIVLTPFPKLPWDVPQDWSSRTIVCKHFDYVFHIWLSQSPRSVIPQISSLASLWSTVEGEVFKATETSETSDFGGSSFSKDTPVFFLMFLFVCLLYLVLFYFSRQVSL